MQRVGATRVKYNQQSKFPKINFLRIFARKYPLRILVAEDNQINQQLALHILGKLGYTPSLAENGQEVLDLLKTEKYDVILMDMQMPEIDGMEATKIIRAEHHDQPVIVAMTANVMQGDKEECLACGMDDYLSKTDQA